MQIQQTVVHESRQTIFYLAFRHIKTHGIYYIAQTTTYFKARIDIQIPFGLYAAAYREIVKELIFRHIAQIRNSLVPAESIERSRGLRLREHMRINLHTGQHIEFPVLHTYHQRHIDCHTIIPIATILQRIDIVKHIFIKVFLPGKHRFLAAALQKGGHTSLRTNAYIEQESGCFSSRADLQLIEKTKSSGYTEARSVLALGGKQCPFAKIRIASDVIVYLGAHRAANEQRNEQNPV